MKRRELLASLPALAAGACGYRAGGKADLLPRNIQTIAIPAFSNLTTRYRVADRLAIALSREFMRRSRYAVINDPEQADAVLRGTVVNYSAFPTIFDANSSRAAGVQVSMLLQVSLTERASGKVLYNRPGWEVRERYEISVDESQYFEESDTALERLSQDVARTVVAAVLSGF